MQHDARRSEHDVPPVRLMTMEMETDDTTGLAVGAVRLDHVARAGHPLLAVRLDEPAALVGVHREVANDDTVNHEHGEYVRYRSAGAAIHTNTVEGFYSIFKRGMKGVYQHCKEKHLYRYLAEFDFRCAHRVIATTVSD